MSGIRLLADTNAFIYLLNGHPSLQPLLESTWLYSFITEIELLGKPGITPVEIKKLKAF
jgi:predicted nucleic acid-binding protein